VDTVFILVDENDPLVSDLSFDNMFVVKSASEIRCLNDNICKKTSQLLVKIVVLGNDQYLNKYIQSYIELIKMNESIQSSIQHYFVPRNRYENKHFFGYKITESLIDFFGKIKFHFLIKFQYIKFF